MARRVEKHTSRIRLFLVDDEAAVRRGLELLLSHEPNLEVCGSAGSLTEALQQILLLKPDLAVVDLRLRHGDGLKLIRKLRRSVPGLKLLVFSMHQEPSLAEAALRAGADGYVTKNEGTEKLVEAVACVMAGKPYVTLSDRLGPER